MSEQINKQCPICGEYISINDDVCKFCGEKLPEDTAEISQENTDNNNISEHKDVDAGSKEPKDSNISDENDDLNNNNKSGNKFNYIVIVILTFFIGIAVILTILFFVHKSIDVSIAPPYKEKPKISHNILKSKNSEKTDKAKALYKDGHIDEAAELFQEEIDSSGDPVAYYYMGEIYKDQGFNKIALSNYKKALDSKKDFFEPLKRIAEIYVQRDEYDQALEYATKAQKQKPKDIDLLKILAKIYIYNDDDDKIISTYKQIASIDKKDYTSNHYLATYYYDKDEYKEAIPYLSNLLNTEYNTSLAYTLANCYTRIEYYTKAMEVLDLIIKKDPYEYYSATYAKSRISDMKDYYNATHKKTNKPANNKNNYDEEAEDALF